jgi:hypothetical protein
MFAGSAEVYLLRDLSRAVTLEELSTYDTFPEPVFSFDGVRITVGYLERVVNCGKAHTKRVILDNNEGIIVTPDQEFIYLDGTVAKVTDLELDKSLMPLYLQKSFVGYSYKENTDYFKKALTSQDSHSTRLVARMVIESKIDSRFAPNMSARHIDKNRNNCHPNNLTYGLKRKTKPRKKLSKLSKAILDAKEIIKEFPDNHKVVEISDGPNTNIYGLVVAPSNNIAIGGIFMTTTKDE